MGVDWFTASLASTATVALIIILYSAEGLRSALQRLPWRVGRGDAMPSDPRFEQLCIWSAISSALVLSLLASAHPALLVLSAAAATEAAALSYFPALSVSRALVIRRSSFLARRTVPGSNGHASVDQAGHWPGPASALIFLVMSPLIWVAVLADLAASPWRRSISLTPRILLTVLAVLPVTLMVTQAWIWVAPNASAAVDAISLAICGTCGAAVMLAIFDLLLRQRDALLVEYLPKHHVGQSDGVFSVALVASDQVSLTRSSDTPRAKRMRMVLIGLATALVIGVLATPPAPIALLGNEAASLWLVSVLEDIASMLIPLVIALICFALIHRAAEIYASQTALMLAGQLPLHAQRENAHRLNNLMSGARLATERVATAFEQTPADQPVVFDGAERTFLDRRLKAARRSFLDVEEWLDLQLERSREFGRALTQQIIASNRRWVSFADIANEVLVAAQFAGDRAKLGGHKLTIRYGIIVDRKVLHLEEFSPATDPAGFTGHADVTAIRVCVSRPEFLDALISLVKNGVDALDARAQSEPADTPWRPRIDVAVNINHLSGEPVSISILDNGPGIPEKVRDRIGQIYVTTKGVGRHGIGVFSARQSLLAHRGRLTFTTSANKEGKTFTEFVAALPQEAVRFSGSVDESGSPQAGDAP